MNYFLLAEPDFFRLINEAGDCNMETASTAFATQVIEPVSYTHLTDYPVNYQSAKSKVMNNKKKNEGQTDFSYYG